MDIKDFKVMSDERRYNSLRRTCNKLGYLFYEGLDYNLNIIAIRNVDELSSCGFNDLLAVAYLKAGLKTVDVFTITTDPGRAYRVKPMNKKGTAIVLPQQIHGGFKLGTHKGYTALVQNFPFAVLRDDDRDVEVNLLAAYTINNIKSTYNLKPITKNYYQIYDNKGNRIVKMEVGMFGINMHRASKWKVLERVGLYSAGCIVHQNPYKYKTIFLPLLYKAKQTFGDTFTMTLITNDKLY